MRCALLSFLVASVATNVAAQTVPSLNTTAYLGRWYQTYSDLIVEATFENASYCDTADYGLNPNGTISVLNRERQYGVDGPERAIYGWAAAGPADEPGQLTVHLDGTGSFGVPSCARNDIISGSAGDFGAPYWIYALGPIGMTDGLYRYSIVSDPLKATLFVLARNVTEFYAQWNVTVRGILAELGFTGVLNSPLTTVQVGCAPW
jgi:apolipoprotein D and lipocalin family protein